MNFFCVAIVFFYWQGFIQNTTKYTTVNNGETLIMMQMKGAFKELSKSKSLVVAMVTTSQFSFKNFVTISRSRDQKKRTLRTMPSSTFSPCWCPPPPPSPPPQNGHKENLFLQKRKISFLRQTQSHGRREGT